MKTTVTVESFDEMVERKLARARKLDTAVSRDVRALKEKGMLKLAKQPNPGHGQIQVVHAAAKHFNFRADIRL